MLVKKHGPKMVEGITRRSIYYICVMSIKQTFYCLEIVLKQLSQNSETPVAFSLLSCQLICTLQAQSISSKEYP
jgi:hypothetical protein